MNVRPSAALPGTGKDVVDEMTGGGSAGPSVDRPRWRQRVEGRRRPVLSIQDQQVVDDRPPLADGGAPARRGRARPRTPTAFVVVLFISVLAVIGGAVWPGLGMAVAVALGWSIWRYVPSVADLADAADPGDDEEERR
jgi:hypothetical protein